MRWTSWFGPRRVRGLGVALAFGVLGVLFPVSASAHFSLQVPASWMSQDAQGSPQKTGPCGNEPGGTASNKVTAYQAGETIMVQWTELVPHDGWYRISLSYNNRTDFTDPPVVVGKGGLAADAGIESPAVPPVLADGLFPHSAASTKSGKQYMYALTLPTTPCAKCTLQVIQFMNDHGTNAADGSPDGFFYHHCADISISDDGGVSGGGSSSGGAAGSSSGGGAPMDASSAVEDATAAGSSSSSSGSGGGGSNGGSNIFAGSNSSGGNGSSSGTATASGSSGTGGGGLGTSGSSSGSAGGNDGLDASGNGASQPSSGGGGSGGGCLIASGGGSAATAGLAGLLAVAALGRRRRRR